MCSMPDSTVFKVARAQSARLENFGSIPHKRDVVSLFQYFQKIYSAGPASCPVFLGAVSGFNTVRAGKLTSNFFLPPEVESSVVGIVIRIQAEGPWVRITG